MQLVLFYLFSLFLLALKRKPRRIILVFFFLNPPTVNILSFMLLIFIFISLPPTHSVTQFQIFSQVSFGSSLSPPNLSLSLSLSAEPVHHLG